MWNVMLLDKTERAGGESPCMEGTLGDSLGHFVTRYRNTNFGKDERSEMHARRGFSQPHDRDSDW